MTSFIHIFIFFFTGNQACVVALTKVAKNFVNTKDDQGIDSLCVPPPPKSLPRSPQNSLTPRPTFWEYFLCFVQVPRLCFTPVSAASFSAFSIWQTQSSQTSGLAPTQEYLRSWSPHKVVTRRLSSTCSAILKPVTSDSRAMMGQLCFTWQLVRLNITSTCLFNQCWSNRYCSFFS